MILEPRRWLTRYRELGALHYVMVQKIREVDCSISPAAIAALFGLMCQEARMSRSAAARLARLSPENRRRDLLRCMDRARIGEDERAVLLAMEDLLQMSPITAIIAA